MKNIMPFHPLTKTTDTPPAWAQGKVFEDAFGNKLKLVKHSTPTTGVLVLAGGPVGYLDAGDDMTVTTDISQSAAGKVAGATMVALTAAEALAGTYWHFIMIEGSLKEYMAGGRGVPLGDSTKNGDWAAFDTVPTDDSVADGEAIVWAADSLWSGVTEPVDGSVAAGRSLAADAGADPYTLGCDEVIWHVGSQMGYTA